MLQPLHGVDHERARKVEPEHRQRVARPVHVLARIDAGTSIDQPFQRTADPLCERRTTFVDRCHVRPERLCEKQQDDEVQPELQPTGDVHSKISGLNIAMSR